MKFKHDKQADAIYIYLSNKPYAYGRDLDDERRIDYASDNTQIGVELLCVSKGVNLDSLPHLDEVMEILKANGIQTYIMGESLVDTWVVFNANFASPATAETEKPVGHLLKEEVTACT